MLATDRRSRFMRWTMGGSTVDRWLHAAPLPAKLADMPS